MARHWIYIPFGDKWHDDQWIDLSRKHYKWKYGGQGFSEQNKKTVIKGGRGVLTKPLKNIGADDVLIVVGHGDEFNPTVICYASKQDGTVNWNCMTFDDLGDQLIREGLPPGHQVVKMWMCWSGATRNWGYAPNANKFLPITSTNRCFASLLAAKLGHTHKNIVVGGPIGMASQFADPSHAHGFGFVKVDDSGAIIDPAQIEYFTTRGKTAWFGADGQPASRPAFRRD